MSGINKYVNNLSSNKINIDKGIVDRNFAYNPDKYSLNYGGFLSSNDFSKISVVDFANIIEKFNIGELKFLNMLEELFANGNLETIKTLFLVKKQSAVGKNLFVNFPHFMSLLNGVDDSVFEYYISGYFENNKNTKYDASINPDDVIEVISDYSVLIGNKLYIVDVNDLKLRHPDYNYVNTDKYNNFFTFNSIAIPDGITDIVVSAEKNVSNYLHFIETIILGDCPAFKTRLLNKCSNCRELVVFSSSNNGLSSLS